MLIDDGSEETDSSGSDDEEPQKPGPNDQNKSINDIIQEAKNRINQDEKTAVWLYKLRKKD